jgi:DNA mismatch repair ATPase MutS
MLHDALAIEMELKLVEKVFGLLENHTQSDFITKVQIKLMQLRDIRGSVNNVKSNLVLDDVELFEIKSFAIVAQEIGQLQRERGNEIIEIPDLNELIDILDPQGNRIPSFYIYDSYSEELAGLRKEMKSCKKALIDQPEDAELKQQLEQLFNRSQEVEAVIREEICSKIKSRKIILEEALQNVAHLDVVVAKALQAKKLNMCKPSLTQGDSWYQGMFNPQIQAALAQKKRNYQAIDIRIEPSVCFITGANMAGKTVILKTLALCQYLAQFGFYVPASAAGIALVDEILISVGDEQSEENGLSSFASEMLKVNRMVEEAQKQSNVLILIDELARTTNPVEGRAIVNAVADIFRENGIRSMITTHYSGLNTNCRKLRVKGLDKDLQAGSINKDNINDYIDYSLVEDQAGRVPHEALRIATMLGINREIIEKAQCQLDETEQTKEKHILND